MVSPFVQLSRRSGRCGRRWPGGRSAMSTRHAACTGTLDRTGRLVSPGRSRPAGRGGYLQRQEPYGAAWAGRGSAGRRGNRHQPSSSRRRDDRGPRRRRRHTSAPPSGGALSSIVASHAIGRYRRTGLELYGADGTANLLGDDWDPAGFEIWRAAAGRWEQYDSLDPTWHWSAGLNEFVEAIRDDRAPLVDLDHDLHVLDVIAPPAGRPRTRRAVASNPASVRSSSACEPDPPRPAGTITRGRPMSSSRTRPCGRPGCTGSGTCVSSGCRGRNPCPASCSSRSRPAASARPTCASS